MNLTRPLRQQHDELLVLAQELAGQLVPEQLAHAPEVCEATLARLLARLVVHLALEDKLLYAPLLAHPRADVAEVARRFHAGLGSLGAEVRAFECRWKIAGAVGSRPAAFVGECRVLLDALARRIREENRELYAVADSLGS